MRHKAAPMPVRSGASRWRGEGCVGSIPVGAGRGRGAGGLLRVQEVAGGGRGAWERAARRPAGEDTAAGSSATGGRRHFPRKPPATYSFI